MYRYGYQECNPGLFGLPEDTKTTLYGLNKDQYFFVSGVPDSLLNGVKLVWRGNVQDWEWKIGHESDEKILLREFLLLLEEYEESNMSQNALAMGLVKISTCRQIRNVPTGHVFGPNNSGKHSISSKAAKERYTTFSTGDSATEQRDQSSSADTGLANVT